MRWSVGPSTAAVIGAVAMAITLASNAWVARNRGLVWERLLDAAWGIDPTVALVLLLGAATVAGAAIGPARTGNATRALLMGAGVTAFVAGLGMAVTHLLARASDIGDLAVPTGLAIGAIVVSGLVALVASLAVRRPPSLRAWLATWTIVFAPMAIVPTAAFGDNSSNPTPWPISLLVIVAVVAIGVANPSGRNERLGLIALLAMIVWFRWIVDDSVACEDDDCVPLPFSVAWTSVGALFLGAAWWRRDRRRRPGRAEVAAGPQG